jgi:MFS family permease
MKLWQLRHHRWVMLWPLGLAQMTSWGTIYFSFSLFLEPMQAELGWSQPALNGALTVGLLITGMMAYPVGALLDRHGGRGLMTVSSLGCGVLLLLWSQVQSLTQFYALWLLLGVCLSGCLIEPLFAVINQTFDKQARTGIMVVSSITGLAGTVYVPLIGSLIPALEWRDTLIVLAGLNLFFNALVHWIFIPPRSIAAPPLTRMMRARGRVVMRRRLRNPIFWGLALWYTSYSFAGSSVIFQLIPLLRSEQVADRLIFLVFALVGPVQLIARLVIVTVARTASVARIGAGTSSLVPLSILLLIFAPHNAVWLCAFALVFGTGHGITTILRGTAPIEWLGHEHSARTMGAIALPMMFAMALAPSMTAFAWSASGSSEFMLWVIFAGAACGTAGYWIAVLARRRARALGSRPG